MAITNQGSFGNSTIDRVTKKEFAQGFGGIPEERSLFFTVEKSNREQERLTSFSDLGAMGTFTGSLDYGEAKENYSKTVTNTEYARGLAIQRKLWETAQVRTIKRLPQLLGKSAKLRFVTDAYSLFNNAFNTTHTGGDGLALCSSAHTSNVGGSNQSNLATTALSAPAVDAARVAMGKYNTATDNAMFNVIGDTLIVPIDLEEYASEIVESKGIVDSANNNINFHYGRYKVIASRMLTDSNNWFMANSEMMKEHQVWFEVVPLEFEKDKDFNTKVMRWSAYTFYGFGFERWEHIYGHNVS